MPTRRSSKRLIARQRTGEGAELSISMFDAMADWMTVPLLQQEAGEPPKRIGPRPHLDLALRRVQEPRRRRHSHLDPERPRMARAGGKSSGRCRARRRSGLRHQCRARQAPRRNRRQGRRRVRHARRRRAGAKARRRRHRLCARQHARPSWRAIRICAASPSARRAGRCPIRRRPSRTARSRHYGPVPALGEHTDKVRAEFSLPPVGERRVRVGACERRR